MTKKISVVLTALLLVSVLAVGLAACNDKDEFADAKTIVFVGDSIAEALIGPSPVAERDNYGYYALLGRTNNFKYYNHAVSGHKTSGGMIENADGSKGDGLLEMLMRDDENAALMKTHLMQADIIHISVLGNNLLQYNLGLLLLEVADPEFDEKYEKGETLLNFLHDGSSYEETDDDGNVISVLKDGCTRESIEKPGEVETFDFPPTYQNLCDIIARIKNLNPKATIFFQTVYNPFFENCTHLHEPIKNALKEKYDIEGVEEYRKLASKLIGILNGMIDEYLTAHPGDFIKLDVKAAFDKVVKEDGEGDLSEDGLGRSLIFADYTHPSNFGHAIIAEVTQKELEKLGLAAPDALDNYKAIKVEQLERMYKDVKGFDFKAAKSAVEGAKTMHEATLAYFAAIKGYTPINY